MSKILRYKEWLAKYFPVKPSRKMTWAEAVEHSIRKWQGAHQEVLERYGGIKGGSSAVYFESGCKPFSFDKSTCALCVKTGLERKNCEPCPLYHARGGVECSAKTPNEIASPYEEFKIFDDPAAMLKWLRATRRFLKTKKWKIIEAGFGTKHKGVVK